jgi:amino acid adenylation domain-containing protein/non-ribosomal peptide synthase protein (TIGR01720 family)
MIDKALAHKIAEDHWIKSLKDIRYRQLYTYSTASADAYAVVPLILPGEVLTRLNQVSKGDAKSIFAILMAALAVLHGRYTNTSDVLLTSPGMLHGDRNVAAGNKLFYRIRIPSDRSIHELLQVVKQSLIAAFDNRDYDAASFLERFRKNDTGDEKALSQIGIFLDLLHQQPANQPDNELDVIIRLNGESYIRYNKALLDERLMQQYARYYVRVLSLVVSGKVPLNESEWLDKDDQEMLVYQFNNTVHIHPANTTVVGLFEHISATFPEQIAVQTPERQLTFARLKQYADSLAVYLAQECQLERGQIVGLIFNRNEWAIVAMVGILKAGGVYLPMDPGYPAERLQYMIADSGCQLVLTENEYMDKVIVDTLLDIRLICSESSASMNNYEPSPSGLAYVIYTSGSTGKPKGALIRHSGLLNHISWFNRAFSVDMHDSTLLVTSYSFDGSVTYIWSCLTTGATLHILPDKVMIDPGYLLPYISREAITFLKLVPSFLSLLISHPLFGEADFMKTIRFIKLGGEVVHASLVKKYLQRYPHTVMANHYGPTEATIGATVQLITTGTIADFEQLPVIGRPFDNCRIYILNEEHGLVPPGMVGEIYIGGAGVGYGYLNKPALTEQQFITLPYRDGERVYKTGDMACWTPDGRILFRGRADFQVKIKGFRIELPEIEFVLQQYPLIQQAVVLPGEDNQSLNGYLFAKPGITLVALRTFLLDRLPEFMIPGTFILIDQLPLTLNGKVDRTALAGIKGPRLDADGNYSAPVTAAEVVLVAACESIFKNRTIGVKDHFFLLGGDSIKAILLVSRIKQSGYILSLSDILSFPVLAEMATRMVENTSTYSQDILSGSVPLGPAQIAFLESNTSTGNAFNQSVILYSKTGFEGTILKDVLTVLWIHHDALRMSFTRVNGNWEQVCISIHAPFGWQVADLRKDPAWETAVTTYHRNLVSALQVSGPLLQAALLHCPDGDRLLLVIHHLVTDGVSWRILLEDLQQLYKQGQQKAPMHLPPKTASFGLMQEKLRNYASSKKMQEEVPYWNQLLSADVTCLPVDGEYGVKDSSKSYSLDAVKTSCLISGIHTAYRTSISDILLTALAMTVEEIYGATRFVVMQEGHGREEPGEPLDVSRTVGWFTAKFPVIIDISGCHSPEEKLIQVKETLRNIPGKGIGYGILKYLDKSALIDSRYCRPSFVYNYHGEFAATDSNELFSVTNDLLDKQVMDTGNEDAPLRISAIIANKHLQLSVTYSSRQYVPDMISRLLDRHREHLIQLIDRLSDLRHNVPTPSDLLFKGISLQELDRINKKQDVEDIYPLTPLQEGLYFHWLMHPSSYLQQMAYSIKGTLDLSILEKCYNTLLERYAILRENFTVVEASDTIIQVVRQHRWVPLTFLDMTGQCLDEADIAPLLGEYKQERYKQGIDLHQDNLFALSVIKYADDLHGLVWRWHHIICDGWSMSIIMMEFTRMYAAFSAGQELLPAVSNSYRQYISWLQKIDKATSLQYWEKYLDGYDKPATLPLLDTTTGRAYHFREMYLKIDNEKSRRIQTFCKQNAVTENIFFTTLWSVLLSKYNNSSDVVFGAVVSGRPPELPGIEHMVGLFINTIPVRVKVDADTTVLALMQQVQKEFLAGSQHHYVQLAEIQACSKLNTMLLNHILVFENYPVDEAQWKNIIDMNDKAGLSVHAINETRQNQTNYPFNIVIRSDNAGMEIAFTFNDRVLEDDVVTLIMNDLEVLIEQVLILPENKVLNLRFNIYFKHSLAKELNTEKDLKELF